MQPLQWMRSFEATARHGSETRAAEELGMTQATVSQHIKALETRVGLQLFERQARGMTLSGAGAELYLAVADGIGRIDAALENLGAKDGNRLHILSNASLAAVWLVPRLSDFTENRRDFRLRLTTALWETDAIGVRADVSLYLGPERSSGDVEIPGGDLVAVAAANRDVDGTMIRITGFEQAYNSFRRAQAGTGKSRAATSECDSFQAALELASNSAATAFAPRLLATGMVRSGRLRVLGPWEHHPKTAYWTRALNPRQGAVRDFQSWVVEQAETTLSQAPRSGTGRAAQP